MTAPLSDSSSSSFSAAGAGAGVGAAAAGGVGVGSDVGAGAGVGAIITASVTDVTVAFSGTISFTTTVRPEAASFSTKAVENADAKPAALVGSSRVSSTAWATAGSVVTSSYSILSFAPCNCLF